jgi:hypothetical protein
VRHPDADPADVPAGVLNLPVEVRHVPAGVLNLPVGVRYILVGVPHHLVEVSQPPWQAR